MTVRYAAFVVVVSCITVLSATAAHAQLDFGAGLSLSIAPQHPAPGDTVRITAQGSLLDLEAGEITWYINSAERVRGAGLIQIEVTAGALGSETRIKAVFTEAGFERAAAEALVRPTEIDLLWESDAYTPLLFRGRALPSPGTSLRMEAIPRFTRVDGSLVPVNEIMFTWRKNGYVIQSASGRGKSKVNLPSPPLFGADTVSVETQTPDGSFAGEASVRIPSIEPVLTLYENHPLFGIMYHQALGVENFLPEVEMSFVAVPYFADTSGPNDRNLTYEWRVDGNAIPNDASRPSEITINARGSSGIALIELALSHATNLFLNALGSWKVTLLGENAGGVQGNPFRETP